jgi:hypothetical protein
MDPGLMQTQKLDGPVIAESIGSDQAFEDQDIVEPVDATDIDTSFIDELEDSLAEEIRRDQLGN